MSFGVVVAVLGWLLIIAGALSHMWFRVFVGAMLVAAGGLL
ncbi:hypothetical protein [Caldimonas mangrovi]|nr:hypothetical protein [Caldimonas mangrovi]